MREAIERVIAELEKSKLNYRLDNWNIGWTSATNLAISKLKEVLAQHADNPSERIPTDAERTE